MSIKNSLQKPDPEFRKARYQGGSLRLTIPPEIRDEYGIEQDDPLKLIPVDDGFKAIPVE